MPLRFGWQNLWRRIETLCALADAADASSRQSQRPPGLAAAARARMRRRGDRRAGLVSLPRRASIFGGRS